MLLTALASLPLLLAPAAQDAPDAPAFDLSEDRPYPEKGVELVYLGGEAFLLRARAKTLLVDGFLTGEEGLPEMPAEVAKAMIQADGVFGEVRVCLATHFHGTDFRTEDAAEFLRRRFAKKSKPVIFEAPPTLQRSVEREVGPTAAGTMINARWQPVGKENFLSVMGLRVDYLRIPHVSDPDAEIEHNSFVTRAAGVRMFFTGHGELTSENLAPYQSIIANTDLAVVPYDQLLDRASRRALRDRVAPRQVIATGVPTEGAAEIAEQLEAAYPGVIVLSAPFQRRLFVPRPKEGGR